MFSRPLVFIILATIFAVASNGQEIRSLLDRNEKFTANGKISEDDLYGFPTFNEEGVLNGVAYRIHFLDGSGTFEGVKGNGIERKWNKNKTVTEGLKDIEDMKKNWMIGCREDGVDILTCIMVIPGISVFVNTKGQEFVAVHGDGDPRGLIVGIRLENGETFTGAKDTQFVGSSARQIVEGLKSAKQVTTSYRKPNARKNITRTIDLYAFNEAFAYINWVVGKCKKTYDARKGSQPDITGGGFQTCKSY